MFQKSTFTTILLVLICSLSLMLTSCKKDDNPTNPGGGGGGTAGTPTSQFGAFPVPSVADIGGVFGVVDLPITVSGFTVESKIAFGGFYSGTSSSGTLVYGGDVKIGTISMDTSVSGSNTLYSLPGKHLTSTSPTVAFDGTTVATFTMAGGSGGITAFTASVTPPVPSSITAPVANATLSHSSAQAITWDHATGTDTVLVYATDANGHQAVKNGLVASAGTVTLSTTDLASFSGNGIIMVVKYRYAITAHGGKNYAVIGETAGIVNVTWN